MSHSVPCELRSTVYVCVLQLQEDEEELQREEEAYIAARREAARIAQLQKEKEEAVKTTNGPKTWSSGKDGDWEV